MFNRSLKDRYTQEITREGLKTIYENQIFCFTELFRLRNQKLAPRLNGTKEKAEDLINSGKLWEILQDYSQKISELEIRQDETTFVYGYDDVIKLIDESIGVKTANFGQAVGTNEFRDCTVAIGLVNFRYPFSYKYLVAELFGNFQVVDDLENEKRVQAMGRIRDGKIVLLFPFDHPQFPNVQLIDNAYFCRDFIHSELLKAISQGQSVDDISKNDFYKSLIEQVILSEIFRHRGVHVYRVFHFSLLFSFHFIKLCSCWFYEF